jgi:diguanylate cyclase (GGDEF)-like protein
VNKSGHRQDPSAVASQQLAERAMAAMFASGASVALLAVLLTPLEGAHHPWVSLNAALGYPSAAFLFQGRGRYPMAVLHVLLAVGSLQVAVGMYLLGGGAPSAGAGALLVWVALYAFYFFPSRHAVVHLLIAGVGLAAGLALLREPGGLAAWMFTFGTGVVAGAIVGHLTSLLRRSARMDPLTGVANRLAWEEAVEQEMVTARRHRRPLTIVVVDLDDLKTINDENGHQAGDDALCDLVQALQEQIRQSDLVARLGGDEFGLALPDTSPEDAETMLGRVRQSTACRFSAGIGAWDSSEPLGAAVARVDAALYLAKAAGRNTTVMTAAHDHVPDLAEASATAAARVA